MNYLSIGTNVLLSELFLEIKNTDKIKPTGGLWATIYEGIHYNEWVDYLCSHPHLIFYHNYEDPYSLPAVKFTLKSDSQIFIVDSIEKIYFLKSKYPYKSWIDYEKLSQDYDGIYIDIRSLSANDDKLIQDIINAFSVNTLVLFNTNCIDFYQKATIDLSSIDFENPFEYPEYTIQVNTSKKQINEANNKITTLIETIKKYITDNDIKINYENYEIIKATFQEAISKTLKSCEISQNDILLIRKVFNQF